MTKSLGVFHSSYYNRDPFKFSFSNFRKHFPDSPYVIYSDMGDDFSEYVNENTHYRRSDIRYYGSGEKCYWRDNWDLWYSYYERLKISSEICNTDYILVMEDDVLITRKFDIEKDFNFCGPCSSKLSDFIINYIENKIGGKINPFYGLCGGSIFNSKIFLDNYENILENLKKFHFEYSNNLKEPQSIVPDGNFTIQFNLLGLDYSCSPWMKDGSIIHPYKI
jgi:hypothetical protein